MLNAEGDADFGNTGLALDAMRKSKFVVSISPYDHSAARQYANLILPNCPFTETAGTFVNIEGIPQRFRGVVRPLGESRPAWKILRVLGNLLGLKGFSYQTIDDVQDDLTFLNGDISDRLNNNVSNDFKLEIREQEDKFERIGEVSIYSTDGIVRRSGALQNTRDGGFKGVGMCGSDMKSMGLNSGDLVIVKQGMVEVELPISKDDATAKSSVRLPGGHLECQKLGPLNGPISIKVSKKLSSLPSHEPN